MISPPDLLVRWAPQAPVPRALVVGAGQGDEASWLAHEGFEVDAVEKDPGRSAALAATFEGVPVRVQQADIQNFRIQPNHYGLIVALAVLHFISPTELPGLAKRIVRGLVPHGLLLAQVLTDEDPSLQARRAQGVPEPYPRTFPIDDGELIHYFSGGELPALFTEIEVLEHEAYRFVDTVREAGYGAGEDLVARRSAEG